MEFKEYKDWNPKFFPVWTAMAPDEMVLHWAILEMTGEAGEVLELVQKSVRKQKEISKEKLLDELSDVFWGFTAICNIAGFTYEQVMQHNHDKLEERNKNKEAA